MFDSISFFRVIKTGAVNFWRNIWLSAGATMVMTITLVIFALLFLLFSIANFSVKTVRERVEISVYVKKNLLEEQALKFRNQILDFGEVRAVNYISAQEVLNEFKKKNQNETKVLAALNEVSENPFGATLRIKAKNFEDYPKISEKLQNEAYQDLIKDINYEDNREVIEKLGKILKIIITFGSGLAAVFAIIAILVIFNTIALTIHNRREEVEIMRLVGATNWYIRGPFLTESILYGLFATAIAALLLVPVFWYVLPKIAQFVSPELTIFNQNIFSFWFLALSMPVLAVILSVVSTFLAIRKYLKI